MERHHGVPRKHELGLYTTSKHRLISKSLSVNNYYKANIEIKFQTTKLITCVFMLFLLKGVK